MKNNSIQQLEKIKKKLETLREEQLEDNTRKKVIIEDLKKEFKCNNIKEAEEFLAENKADFEERESEFEEKVDELVKEMKDNGII